MKLKKEKLGVCPMKTWTFHSTWPFSPESRSEMLTCAINCLSWTFSLMKIWLRSLRFKLLRELWLISERYRSRRVFWFLQWRRLVMSLPVPYFNQNLIKSHQFRRQADKLLYNALESLMVPFHQVPLIDIEGIFTKSFTFSWLSANII